MIFTIQRSIEDYFSQRNLDDSDSYAVRLANQFASYSGIESPDQLHVRLARLRTNFYKCNSAIERAPFIRALVKFLGQKFIGKNSGFEGQAFFTKQKLAAQRKRLKERRRSILEILECFRDSTEARNIDVFWDSRKKLQLRKRAEKIGQSMLSQFIQGVLTNRGGRLFREIYSGVGFVDIAVMFGNVPHLIELKVLKCQFQGPAQLETYMKNEKRKEGWLLIFDARPHSRKTDLPERMKRKAGTIKIVVVDLNPAPPSSLKD